MPLENSKERSNMPHTTKDPHSGAFLFHPTEEEKKQAQLLGNIGKLVDRVQQLEDRVDKLEGKTK
jgi:hypothetical protein